MDSVDLPHNDLQLIGPDGQLLRRGRFRFLILTPEQDLRAFWMDESGMVPEEVWIGLSPEQRSHLCMDRRNQEFRQDLKKKHLNDWKRREDRG